MELYTWEHLALAKRLCEGSVVSLNVVSDKQFMLKDKEKVESVIVMLQRAIDHLQLCK